MEAMRVLPDIAARLRISRLDARRSTIDGIIVRSHRALLRLEVALTAVLERILKSFELRTTVADSPPQTHRSPHLSPDGRVPLRESLAAQCHALVRITTWYLWVEVE